MVHNDSYPDLTWKTPIVNFLREDFVLQDEWATWHTTVEDAMSHRTGLPRHDLSYGWAENETPSSIVKRMRYLPLTYAPRTQFQYCNIMFTVMTDLIQTITGVEQGRLTSEKIWRPLGMSSTTYDLDSVLADQTATVARGYHWTSNETYVAEPYLNLLPVAGAGAVISNVNDYSLWAKALLDAAKPDTATNSSSPITRELWNDVTRPRTIVIEHNQTTIDPPLYALGWVALNILGKTVVTHSGSVPGFGTELWLVPELGFGIVTMGNTIETSHIAGLAIVSRLLVKKFGLVESAESSVRKMLDRTFDTDPFSNQKSATTLHKEHHETRFPLPGPIEKFAGKYSHPGYGPIDLKALSSNSLRAYFSSHTWPVRLDFSHLTDTVFALNISQPHGMGDLESTSEASGVIWSLMQTGKAAFKMDLDGYSVRELGMQLEPDMVEVATLEGKSWEEGMIWFKKI